MLAMKPHGCHAGNRLFLIILIVPLSAVSLFAKGTTQDGTSEIPPSENAQILVDTRWLSARLDDKNIVVVDFRKNRRAYVKNHIPGAAHIERSAVLTRVDGVPYMMTPQDDLFPVLENAGIGSDKTVVVYDENNGLWSARLFWTLEYLGHNDVRVLNGGWSKWIYEDLPTNAEYADPEPGRFRPRARGELVVDMAWLLEHFDDGELLVLDVRSPEEYTGTEIRALRSGHVPGASNEEWLNAVTPGPVNVLKSREELRELYGAFPLDEAEKIVTYCQWGVRAAHTYFTLRYLGYENIRVYDGSWIEWGNRFFTPVEK